MTVLDQGSGSGSLKAPSMLRLVCQASSWSSTCYRKRGFWLCPLKQKMPFHMAWPWPTPTPLWRRHVTFKPETEMLFFCQSVGCGCPDSRRGSWHQHRKGNRFRRIGRIICSEAAHRKMQHASEPRRLRREQWHRAEANAALEIAAPVQNVGYHCLYRNPSECYRG